MVCKLLIDAFAHQLKRNWGHKSFDFGQRLRFDTSTVTKSKFLPELLNSFLPSSCSIRALKRGPAKIRCTVFLPRSLRVFRIGHLQQAIGQHRFQIPLPYMLGIPYL